MTCSTGFFGPFEKKTQGKKTLKTQGSNGKLKPKPKKVGTFFVNFWTFLCKNNKNKNQNIRKWIKTQEKTQNLR